MAEGRPVSSVSTTVVWPPERTISELWPSSRTPETLGPRAMDSRATLLSHTTWRETSALAVPFSSTVMATFIVSALAAAASAHRLSSSMQHRARISLRKRIISLLSRKFVVIIITHADRCVKNLFARHSETQGTVLCVILPAAGRNSSD